MKLQTALKIQREEHSMGVAIGMSLLAAWIAWLV
jgi:hypothetical protein